MADTSTLLGLPYILPAQAQKHVTHNEAIRLLDVLVQLAVADRDRDAPPASPAEGQRHIVAAGASGDWAGQAGKVAVCQAGLWQFLAPQAGWRAWIAAEEALAVFDGAGWAVPAEAVLEVAELGIAATPDATNRLALAAPAALFSHAGAGHQLKINKAAASDSASLLFQTGYSGRAELGTTGSEDFALKVSADGSLFRSALSAEAATGRITLHEVARLAGQAGDPADAADGMLWRDSASGEIRMRSAGATVVVGAAAAGIADGDRGDVTVSGAGSLWSLAPAVKYGVQIALGQGVFFN